METIEQVKKAFREARIVGEQLLSSGRITWEQYAFTMVQLVPILLRSSGNPLNSS